MDKNFWREYFSIPNIMGYFRIALAMLYMLLFYRALDGAPYWPVIVTIVISGITDFFDGKIARRFNMITDWGKMLDPIADKITLGAIIISMSFKYSIVVPMVVFYIIKEGYMAVAGIISIRAGHKIEGAMWYGKVCTFATYVILIVLLLFPNMPEVMVNVLVIADMIIMAFTLIKYFIYHRGLWEELRGKLPKNMEK